MSHALIIKHVGRLQGGCEIMQYYLPFVYGLATILEGVSGGGRESRSEKRLAKSTRTRLAKRAFLKSAAEVNVMLSEGIFGFRDCAFSVANCFRH